MSKYLSIVFLLAHVEARFGQEQTPVSAVTALSNFGQSGQAASLGGAVPGVLLAAANPCAKLTLADEIVSTLGNDPAVIKGAAAVVAAEQNFNPFNVAVPSICSDATLPATAELRGIVPLIDPAVTGSDVENANSATSLTTPFDATGLSVAEVMTAQGFSNFTSVDATGAKAAAAPAAAAAGNAAASANTAAASNSSSSAADASNSGCQRPAKANGNAASNSTASASTSAGAAGNSTAAAGAATSLAGADFGLCTPTMDFQAGRPGRKADESTFLPTDPLVAKGQQDALNPNIITNRICDQLTNVCEANQAAKDACLSAKATVAALGTKDQTTADAFNQALGF